MALDNIDFSRFYDGRPADEVRRYAALIECMPESARIITKQYMDYGIEHAEKYVEEIKYRADAHLQGHKIDRDVMKRLALGHVPGIGANIGRPGRVRTSEYKRDSSGKRSGPITSR